MPYIHKDIDLVASIYIVYLDRILLVFHKKVRNWLPIGGHIELHEDAEEALNREIREECGLEVTILSSPLPRVDDATSIKFLPVPTYFDIHYYDESHTHRHMNLVYFGISRTNQAKLAEEEHDALRWFTSQELDDPKWNVWPTVKFYAQEAIKHAHRYNA